MSHSRQIGRASAKIIRGENAGIFTPTVNALRKMGFEVKGEQPNIGHTLRAEEVKKHARVV